MLHIKELQAQVGMTYSGTSCHGWLTITPVRRTRAKRPWIYVYELPPAFNVYRCETKGMLKLRLVLMQRFY
jgi:hypothetical protein